MDGSVSMRIWNMFVIVAVDVAVCVIHLLEFLVHCLKCGSRFPCFIVIIIVFVFGVNVAHWAQSNEKFVQTFTIFFLLCVLMRWANIRVLFIFAAKSLLHIISTLLDGFWNAIKEKYIDFYSHFIHPKKRKFSVIRFFWRCVFLFFFSVDIQKHEYKWNKYDNQYVNGCIVTNRCRRSLSLSLFLCYTNRLFSLAVIVVVASLIILCSPLDLRSKFIEDANTIFTIITLFIQRNFIRFGWSICMHALSYLSIW